MRNIIKPKTPGFTILEKQLIEKFKGTMTKKLPELLNLDGQETALPIMIDIIVNNYSSVFIDMTLYRYKRFNELDKEFAEKLNDTFGILYSDRDLDEYEITPLAQLINTIHVTLIDINN